MTCSRLLCYLPGRTVCTKHCLAATYGHRARKRTRLYIVGCAPSLLPPMPMVLGEATHTVGLWSGRDKANCRPPISKREFESTPIMFAAWLLEVARRAGVRK